MAVIACSGDAGSVRLATLREDPAADLAVPGAVIVSEIGRDEVWTPTGTSRAFYGHLSATDLLPADVQRYFDQALRDLGWRLDDPPLTATTERQGWAWCKPGIRFRLTIVDPSRLRRTGVEISGDLPPTVYDATLVATDASCE